MQNNDSFDAELKSIVRSVEHEVPPGLVEKVQAATKAQKSPHRFSFSIIRQPVALASLSVAAIIFLAFLFIPPSVHRHAAPQIAEIRTEFELADKNIKIIFVQKPDFPVLLTAY